MDRVPNHTCKACGIAYWACNDCDAKHFIAWRAIACTPEHYQAYMILWEYGRGQISKDDARMHLKSFGAENWVNAPSKSLIDEIMNAEADVCASNMEKTAVVKKRSKKKTVTEM
jgi:hypothetical protein